MHRFLIWYGILSPILFALIVVLLGFITPGYDPLERTISELVLGRYGWLQQLNFIQLAGCLLSLSHLFQRSMVQHRAQSTWRTVMLLCAGFIGAVTIVPTAPIEELRASFSNQSLSEQLHWFASAIFYALSPWGILVLSRTVQREPTFSSLAKPTLICGAVCFALVAIWLGMFTTGILSELLGLMQKVIVGVCLLWLEVCAMSIQKNLTPPKNPAC